VFETDGVADLVDDFLAHAVGEHLGLRFRGDAAVGGSLEAVRRDDGAVAVEVGEAEDVVPAPVVEVFAGDADIFLTGADPTREFDELLGPVLVSAPIERAVGDGLGVVERHLAVVDGPESGRSLAFHLCRNVPDRHDVDEHERR